MQTENFHKQIDANRTEIDLTHSLELKIVFPGYTNITYSKAGSRIYNIWWRNPGSMMWLLWNSFLVAQGMADWYQISDPLKHQHNMEMQSYKWISFNQNNERLSLRANLHRAEGERSRKDWVRRECNGYLSGKRSVEYDLTRLRSICTTNLGSSRQKGRKPRSSRSTLKIRKIGKFG